MIRTVLIYPSAKGCWAAGLRSRGLRPILGADRLEGLLRLPEEKGLATCFVASVHH